MKSFYSIVRFINNSLSNENLAVGMIVISGKDVFYKFSAEKVNLVKRINPLNVSLLEYTLDKIKSFIDDEIVSNKALFSDLTFNVDYLERLSIYNNGFLKFDKPSGINMSFDKAGFDDFFKRYIELNIDVPAKPVIDRSFSNAISKAFSEPLKNKIDINYKMKKGMIPNLFFDYKLDGIGINGVIYTVKSIDLNAEPPIDRLNTQVTDLESLNHRIDLFGRSTLSLELNENKHYLVVDKYQGKKSSYKNLYDMLKSQSPSDYSYCVIGTSELAKVTEDIKKTGAKKFSEVLSEIS
ncbi:hypothetical protein [Pedobacter arcticus]|uniref:hypothetical protein n=1 Tax=Pedobacter arcticus TaxID=752140 RepID=UPI00030409F5|nr:hypothetical protein [Pedobacter arcticus]